MFATLPPTPVYVITVNSIDRNPVDASTIDYAVDSAVGFWTSLGKPLVVAGTYTVDVTTTVDEYGKATFKYETRSIPTDGIRIFYFGHSWRRSSCAGNTVYLHSWYSKDVIHEVGHALGLGHAGWGAKEYGSPWSVMGAKTGLPDGAHLAKLGLNTVVEMPEGGLRMGTLRSNASIRTFSIGTRLFDYRTTADDGYSILLGKRFLVEYETDGWHTRIKRIHHIRKEGTIKLGGVTYSYKATKHRLTLETLDRG